MEDQAKLIAASCTTGWLDWEHGNLWLAPHGLARIPLGMPTSVAHTFVGVDPAKWRSRAIGVNELREVLNSSARALWLDAAEMKAAWLHRGLLNDRLNVRLNDGAFHKLLWVRNSAATQQVEEALRRWLGPRFQLD